jgi:hypothetical protein
MQEYDPDIVVPPLNPMCLSTNGLKHKLVPLENEGWCVSQIPYVKSDYGKLISREDWNWKEKVLLLVRSSVDKLMR